MRLFPPWLWIGTPLKFYLWLGNRLATGTGLFYFWKRFRSSRLVWLWVVLINATSFGLLVWLFFWLAHRRSAL